MALDKFRTGKALRLKVPPLLLWRVDVVVE